jgi:hypothetical protein
MPQPERENASIEREMPISVAPWKWTVKIQSRRSASQYKKGSINALAHHQSSAILDMGIHKFIGHPSPKPAHGLFSV